ncbi:MAG TPA: hypothetical protein VGH95_05855 [Candidatus Aquirickettsiella sp.]|jgi:hypothetical protein
MQDKLIQLLKKDQINKDQYDLFLLFEQGRPGNEFLKKQLFHSAMEETLIPTESGFAWIDGRRSVWRDIQHTLAHINQLLEGENDE